MKRNKDITRRFRVKPGTQVQLVDHDPAWDGPKEWQELGKEEVKSRAAEILEESRRSLADAQARLFAQDVYSLLVVLQAMDAGGKDGTIKHVFSGINPEGCKVVSFKKPSAEELDHDFLWRINKALPERGKIGIFNRSHYEEVLIVRVHPEILQYQRLPQSKKGKKFWEQRYEDINALEKHLVRNGTLVVKFFLHTSKQEQKERFMERLNNPDKHWKFAIGDVDERQYWDEYMRAFEQALSATSTKWAPWYIIPADRKWIARTLVAKVLENTIRGLNLSYPSPSPVKEKEQAVFQHELLTESMVTEDEEVSSEAGEED